MFFSSSKKTKNTTDIREYTPEHISSLAENEIFVFGSNLSGSHGAGAAYTAYRKFGAKMGIGVGLSGKSYAIPTMQGGVETIAPYVDQFISFACANKDKRFLVTRIGCGIAGFKDKDIAPLFADALSVDNIILPRQWVSILESDTDKKPSDAIKVYNVIILDESGSMNFIKDAAKDGFNKTVDTIKKIQKDYGDTQQQFISLVSFNTARTPYIRKIYDMAPATKVGHINSKTYFPNGATPLLDAIGHTLDSMEAVIGKESKAIAAVTIITDGEENCSKDYNLEQIRAKISKLSEEGWSFSYIGANQDSIKEASKMNINQARNFEFTGSGMADVFDDEMRTRVAFSRKMSNCRPKMSKKEMSELYNSTIIETQDEKK